MNRRSLLAFIGTSSFAFSGCVEQEGATDTPTPTPTPTEGGQETETPSQPVDPDDLDGHVQPDDDPEPIDELVCDDEEFERHPAGYGTVSWGKHAMLMANQSSDCV